MRTAYIATVNLPSRYASAMQVMKNAQAWAKASDDFELITNTSLTGWRKLDPQALADTYGLIHNFRIVSYPLYRLYRSRWYLLRSLFYRLAARRCRARGVNLVFTRTYLLPQFTLAYGIPTIVETHSPPENTHDKMALYSQMTHPALVALVTISEPLAERYRAFGLPPEKILVLPDGVDLERFGNALDKATARSELGISIDEPLAVYVGHLYEDRGIQDILAAANRLSNVRFLLVGGHDADLAAWRSRAGEMKLANVSFAGFVNNSQVPKYLWAADILLMPYSTRCYTAEWMSPLKLFEYMAAERPIVASDLPSLRAVLSHGHNAWLYPPDSGEALADAISQLLDSPELCGRLANQAARDVQRYSWDERVSKVLDFVRQRGFRLQDED